ncbi:hypothetical protein AC1031_006596 [Aphanomyces cochlioides]|nr:hypothetical protein AC1031_006596 [Aphanomyces cochlioides]
MYSQGYYNVLLIFLGIAEESQFQSTVYLSSPVQKSKSSMFLGKVCMALETAVYLPGDTIIHKDEVGREMFIVRNGQVEVLAGDKLPTPVMTSSSSLQLAPAVPLRIVLRDGDFFGETALVAEVR